MESACVRLRKTRIYSRIASAWRLMDGIMTISRKRGVDQRGASRKNSGPTANIGGTSDRSRSAEELSSRGLSYARMRVTYLSQARRLSTNAHVFDGKRKKERERTKKKKGGTKIMAALRRHPFQRSRQSRDPHRYTQRLTDLDPIIHALYYCCRVSGGWDNEQPFFFLIGGGWCLPIFPVEICLRFFYLGDFDFAPHLERELKKAGRAIRRAYLQHRRVQSGDHDIRQARAVRPHHHRRPGEALQLLFYCTVARELDDVEIRKLLLQRLPHLRSQAGAMTCNNTTANA